MNTAVRNVPTQGVASGSKPSCQENGIQSSTRMCPPGPRQQSALYLDLAPFSVHRTLVEVFAPLVCSAQRPRPPPLFALSGHKPHLERGPAYLGGRPHTAY